jgi:two-component system response regulator AtoC
MANERILVVEDEKLIRMSLVDELARQGYRVEEAETGTAGLARVEEGEIDLVLLDYRLPDIDGIQVLREITAKHPETLVILMTAYSSIENAVQAIKLGAYDYLNKPFDMDEMMIRVRKALETTELRREVRLYTTREKEQFGIARLIGRSDAMQKLREHVRRIAHSGASTVLIRGESGTGKDVLAKAIHYESDRARRPFVNVTCTAIPENLLESELFGHEKGAFTDARQTKKGLFELARGGTIFLDEIGDMPPVLQAKLLRFLEERHFRRVGGTEDISVDVRIIAATNRDLEEAVRKGEFRADLYYRLKVIPIEVPPLRERQDDIPLLAQAFIDQLRAELRKPVRSISPEALKVLLAYPWPGNIRELRNAIERAMILGTGERIEVQDLPAELQPGRAKPTTADGVVQLPPQGVRLEEIEEELVRKALERTRGNQSAAARLIGVTRDQLRYRMERMGLLPPPPKRRHLAAAGGGNRGDAPGGAAKDAAGASPAAGA